MIEYGYKAFLELGSLDDEGNYCSSTMIPFELDT